MKIKPTEKSPEMERALESLLGGSRTEAMEDPDGPRCVTGFGCSEPLGDIEKHFRDQISFNEYRISGLCQKCQDKIFAEPEDDEPGIMFPDWDDDVPF